MPRPYDVCVDSRLVDRQLVHQIMTGVFRWSDRYAATVIADIEARVVVKHPFDTREIAETKMMIACNLVLASSGTVAGIEMRPSF